MIIVIWEITFLGIIGLMLHAAIKRYGYTMLMMYIGGLVVWIGFLFLSGLSFQDPNGAVLYASIASYIPVLLLLFLMVYVTEGVVVVRRLIFSVAAISTIIVGFGLSSLIRMNILGESILVIGQHIYDLPNPQPLQLLIFIGGVIVALYIQLIIYQFFANRWPKQRYWLATGFSLWSTLLFLWLINHRLAPALYHVEEHLTMLLVAGSVIWVMSIVYFTWCIKVFSISQTRRPLAILFGAAAEMERALSIAEQARYLAEERYHQLIERSDEVFAFFEKIDGHWRYTVVSPGFERLTGRKVEEMYKNHRSWLSSIHPEDRERVIHELRDRRDKSLTFRLIHTSGETLWVTMHIYVIEDERGEAVRVIAITTDVTTLHMAIEALRESETHYRQLAEHIDEVFWLADIESLSVEYVSPAFEKLWGLPIDAMMGHNKGWRKYVHPEDLPCLDDWLEQLSQRNFIPVEFRIKRPDGQMRWLRWRGYPIEENGRITKVAGVTYDLTAEKEAEMHRQELVIERERSKLVNQFVSDATHDLKTPLSVIISKIDMIRRAHSPEAITRHLDILEQQAERLNVLISDLLTLSKLDFLEEVSRERVLLDRIMHDVVARVQPLADEHRVSLTFDCSCDRPSQLLANQMDITRCLHNIIENAIYYTEEGGSVTVTVQPEDDFARIEVRDTGIGIAEEDQTKIFQRFYRSDKARSTSKGGTGLGLPIARRIVELHGGTITVESEVGLGSTFIIRLPIIPLEQPDKYNIASSQ